MPPIKLFAALQLIRIYSKKESDKQKLIILQKDFEINTASAIIGVIEKLLKVGGGIGYGALHDALTLLVKQGKKNTLDPNELIQRMTQPDAAGDRLLRLVGIK